MPRSQGDVPLPVAVSVLVWNETLSMERNLSYLVRWQTLHVQAAMALEVGLSICWQKSGEDGKSLRFGTCKLSGGTLEDIERLQ